MLLLVVEDVSSDSVNCVSIDITEVRDCACVSVSLKFGD
jgi:hypothetical protein